MIRRPPRSTLFSSRLLFLFFFNDTATTEIYTLSLHDALPICGVVGDPGTHGRVRRVAEDRLVECGHAHDVRRRHRGAAHRLGPVEYPGRLDGVARDRKSTRLNSSH